MSKSVVDMTAEELEQLLAEKKQKEKEIALQKKEEYEFKRDALVFELITKAHVLNVQLAEFKKHSMKRLEVFRKVADEYGKIRSNSKGGFQLRTSDGSKMISLDRNVKPAYDERASQAEALLKDFLEDTIKKADKKTYRTISALMERNKKGDYTPARIASLLKIEDNYNDRRWKTAMSLFKESFQVIDISYSVSFFQKDEQNKDQLIPLSIISV